MPIYQWGGYDVFVLPFTSSFVRTATVHNRNQFTEIKWTAEQPQTTLRRTTANGKISEVAYK